MSLGMVYGSGPSIRWVVAKGAGLFLSFVALCVRSPRLGGRWQGRHWQQRRFCRKSSSRHLSASQAAVRSPVPSCWLRAFERPLYRLS